MPGIDTDSLYIHELDPVVTLASGDMFIIEQAADQNVGKRVTFDDIKTQITTEVNDEVDLFQYVGMFNHLAGSIAYSYSGDNIATIEYLTSPIGIITFNYNMDGTVNYAEGVFTSPVAKTIRNTYGYSSGKITTMIRTVS